VDLFVPPFGDLPRPLSLPIPEVHVHCSSRSSYAALSVPYRID
jgi:hypothetical protein